MKKMIWLASFPRSGNTFARNVLYQSYGLVSTEVNLESLYYSSTHEEYPVVKTHLRPGQVPLRSADHVVIYLVRDGRDALVSIAHHRTNIVAPGSDFLENLEEAIRAEEGSYFGGWGLNVAEWMERADVVIRFEDLIQDPIGQLERVREYLDLPQPEKEALPTFSSQKFGNPKYGPQKGENQLFFRKGKSNGWKEEMPDHLEQLFWKKHGRVMQALGYQRSGERTPLPDSKSIRAASRSLIRHQSGWWTSIKNAVHGWLARSKAAPALRWNIQPDLIVLDTGVDLDQQFDQVLLSQYSPEEIGVFHYPGYWTNLHGQPLAHPEACKVVVTNCSRPELLSRVRLNHTPKWMAWIREPVGLIAEAWMRSTATPNIETITSDRECPDDLRKEIETYIQTYAHRNRMHRVISPQSSFLDVVGNLDDMQKDMAKIAGELGWSNVPILTRTAKEPDPLTQMDWFVQQVSIYNKKDVELYDVWMASKKVKA